MSAQPLYAHWRHKPVVVSGASHGKGPEKQAHAFIQHDAALNAKLNDLHVQLRGGEKVQHEIDRHLVPGIVLPRACVPHVDNLPDLSKEALGILDTRGDDLKQQQVHLMLRQCTPLRRRTKRSQREVQWHEDSYRGMQTLVRCLQGTLLGLYEHCSQAISFANRGTLYQMLRSMLVQDFERVHRCMVRMRYIIKLGVMEHFCNTVVTLSPGVHHMLNKAGQQVQLFREAVNMLCDMFRSELNTALAGGLPVLQLMPDLERLAHSYFERCTRAYRGVITNAHQRVCSLEFARHSPELHSPEQLSFLEWLHPTDNHHVFVMLYKERLPAEFVTPAWHITQCLQVHTLPDCIIQRQWSALERRFPCDPQCIRESTLLHLCIYCTIKRPQVVSPMRYNCITRTYMCSLCAPSAHAVLCVDMQGRMLSIGKNKLVLSCCCCQPIMYMGTGCEYDTNCGPHCADPYKGAQHSKKKDKAKVSTPPVKAVTCFVCHQHNVAQKLDLVDLPSRSKVRYCLCAKHSLPNTLARFVQDEDSLRAALRSRALSRCQ